MNLKKLRKMLYQAQFHMTKTDRIIYGTPLMEHCGKALSAFVLAFTVKDKRIGYLEECIGHFAVLRADLEFCVDENIVKYPKRKEKADEHGNMIPCQSDEDKVSSQKIELFNLIGKIDGDMCRWQASLTKARPCMT